MADVYVGGVKLPAGWDTSTFNGGIVVIRPDVGGMTIDFDARGIRSGWSMRGQMLSTKKYAGRDWRKRLVIDAIAALRERQ